MWRAAGGVYKLWLRTASQQKAAARERERERGRESEIWINEGRGERDRKDGVRAPFVCAYMCASVLVFLCLWETVRQRDRDKEWVCECICMCECECVYICMYVCLCVCVCVRAPAHECIYGVCLWVGGCEGLGMGAHACVPVCGERMRACVCGRARVCLGGGGGGWLGVWGRGQYARKVRTCWVASGWRQLTIS
jgi:hypothetical protein